MSNSNDKLQRQILPIPDIAQVGLTTFSAKDLDTKFPPKTMVPDIAEGYSEPRPG